MKPETKQLIAAAGVFIFGASVPLGALPYTTFKIAATSTLAEIKARPIEAQFVAVKRDHLARLNCTDPATGKLYRVDPETPGELIAGGCSLELIF